MSSLPWRTRAINALKSPRWWARLALELAIVAAIVWAIGAYQSRNLLDSGHPAPELALADLEGRSHTLEDYHGKPTLLVFWATWCSVCKLEKDNITALHRERDDIHVVSVVLGYDSVEEVRAFVELEGIEYPVLLGDQAIADRFKVDRFPTHYMLSASGDIESSTVGYTTELGLSLRVGD